MNKTVTATGLSLIGTDAGNYTVNTTATTTAGITAVHSSSGGYFRPLSPNAFGPLAILPTPLTPVLANTNTLTTPTILTNLTPPKIISAPLVATPNTTFRLGAKGPNVSRIQHFLNTHGFPVSNTGPGSLGNETTYFGQKTEAALKAFQTENGLTSDGIFGPKTKEKMISLGLVL